MARRATRAGEPYRLTGDSAPTEQDDDMVALASDIKALERDGDRLKHDAMKRVRANWITPLDREDIRVLSNGMEEVLNRIDAVAERIVLYRIDVATEEAVERSRSQSVRCRR